MSVARRQKRARGRRGTVSTDDSARVMVVVVVVVSGASG